MVTSKKRRKAARRGTPRPERELRGRPLSNRQNYLFTELERKAMPIELARLMAVQDLGLEGWQKALEKAALLKRPRTPEEDGSAYAEVERQWQLLLQKLDAWILEKLRSGDLLAFGIPLPITPSTIAMPIPTALWRMVELDVENGTATSEGWSFSDLQVAPIDIMSYEARTAIAHGLDVLGRILTREMFDSMRDDRNAHVDAEQVRRVSPTVSAAGSSPGNPIYVALAKVDERLVLKTESLRRNTRYGKATPVATVPDEKDVPEEELRGVSVGEDEVLPDSDAPVREERRTGPRTLNPEIKAYLLERARQGLCKDTLPDEVDHLWSWARREFRDEIRTKQRVLAKKKRLREAMSDSYYAANPKFDRRRRFQQESNSAGDSS